MSESPSPDLRIGDPEREEALRVLGEHMTVGRLDVDEYGERAARASAAKTRGELTALFADLPQPHPQLDRFGTAPAGGIYIQPQPLQRELAAMREQEPRPVAQRIAGALVPLSGILSIVLFFGAHTSILIFLLPAAVAVITGALWGEDQRKRKNKVKYKDKD